MACKFAEYQNIADRKFAHVMGERKLQLDCLDSRKAAEYWCGKQEMQSL